MIDKHIENNIHDMKNLPTFEQYHKELNESKIDTSFLITRHPVIDRIIYEATPLLNKIISKIEENTIKENKIFTDRDRLYIQLDLTMDLVNSLSKYIKKTDDVKDINISFSGGKTTISSTILRDNIEYYFTTQVIDAGGYNIQRYHLRYIANTKLPMLNKSDASDNIKAKMSKMKKEDRIIKTIESYNNTISKYEDRNKKLKSMSDKEIITAGKGDYTWNPGSSISKEDFPEWLSNVHKRLIDSHNTMIISNERQIEHIKKEIAKEEKKLKE